MLMGLPAGFLAGAPARQKFGGRGKERFSAPETLRLHRRALALDPLTNSHRALAMASR